MKKTKLVMLRLPEEAAKIIQKRVDNTGIPFATICKSLIVERLKTSAPVTLTVRGEE